MITQEENDLLTKTGKGMPCGELMRRYWQPAALADELTVDKPLPVTLFGEELILFRDGTGKPALIGRYCAHQGVDMIYGRVEPDGLRCMYHGWLFDQCGKVVLRGDWLPEKERRWDVGQPAYPCIEAGAVIFTYMGPGDPPVLPLYEFLSVAPENRAVTRVEVSGNYLQANESSIDPLHLAFLHPNFQDRQGEKPPFVPASSAAPNSLGGRDPLPVIELDVTEFGLRIYTTGKQAYGKKYLSVTNYIYPNLSAFNGSPTGAGYSAHWHVPIDDNSHSKYAFIFSREQPLTQEQRERIRVETTDDNYLKRTRENRYLQDRESMEAETFSGMGFHFHAQDAFATESQGPVQNRTEEHLVSSDQPIVAARKLLLNAIQAVRDGREPPHLLRAPGAAGTPKILVLSEVIPADANPREYVRSLGG